MKTKVWTGIGVALVVALLVWAFLPRATEVELATVTSGRFERSVREDGKTRLRARYVVSAPLTGHLARITLRQGDPVARGAVLATLSATTPTLLDARARQEQSERIGAMQANVRRAAANIARAQAALAQAQAEFKRSEALAQQGFVAPTQTETARLALEFRQRDLESARYEEHAAQHELEQLRIALRSASPVTAGEEPRAWQLTSPVSGQVLKVHRDSEGVVAAGTPLIEVGDPTQMEVQADLLTEEAASVRPGTPVELSNWGGAQNLQARVRLIEPAAFTKVSALGVEEQRVSVVLDILSPPAQWTGLGDGFKVDLRIQVQVVENAVMVPVSAVFPVGDAFAVFVVEGGRARQQAVDVRARNGNQAWVQAGVQPGVQVVAYPPNTLKTGDRLKPIQR